MMDVQAIGRTLAEARKAGRKLSQYPGPVPDMAQALAIQAAMARAMALPVVGWKVGLTSQRAQALCGVDAPLAGPLFESDVALSGAEWSMLGGDLGVLEAEIGFRLASDLPSRPQAYDRDAVLGAVDQVLPVIEWVNKRLPGDLRESPEWLVADGVINRGLICGAGVAFDRGLDLREEAVQVFVDDKMVSEGLGANALGDPVEVLVWLANDLSTRGNGLRAGDVVATGLICDVVNATPGTRIEARYDRIGRVSLSVTT